MKTTYAFPYVFLRALSCWLTVAAVASLHAQAADSTAVRRVERQPPPATAVLAPVKAVTSAGPGQAGYVHYFLITHPNGELEYQVGIELEDQRIAWSFPEIGVTVSPFVKTGTIDAGGKPFKVEHLHGIRPFAQDAEMRALQKALTPRVALWVDAQTPYCLLRAPGQPFCLSCGDFVVRILWPGSHPLIPALPQDFVRSTGAAYTTDDLLIYLVGLHNLPDRASMLAQLDKLDIPKVMREDLLTMLAPVEPDTAPTAVAAAPPPVAAPASLPKAAARTTPSAQPATPKPAPAGRIATRRVQAKRI